MMRPPRLFNLRSFVAMAGVLIFAAVGYAMAASNMLPSSRAGAGASAITSYTLDTTTAPNTTTSRLQTRAAGQPSH